MFKDLNILKILEEIYLFWGCVWGFVADLALSSKYRKFQVDVLFLYNMEYFRPWLLSFDADESLLGILHAPTLYYVDAQLLL